jgi:catechol 2,3-dioxygenase-like lactoylglutathione lyase family enzyme
MARVSVRYIVHDVDAAIAFYVRQLGFKEEMHPAPAFAVLSRGDLRLLLSAPGGAGGGGQAMPDGRVPEPGGWNRISLEVAPSFHHHHFRRSGSGRAVLAKYTAQRNTYRRHGSWRTPRRSLLSR